MRELTCNQYHIEDFFMCVYLDNQISERMTNGYSGQSRANIMNSQMLIGKKLTTLFRQIVEPKWDIPKYELL